MSTRTSILHRPTGSTTHLVASFSDGSRLSWQPGRDRRDGAHGALYLIQADGSETWEAYCTLAQAKTQPAQRAATLERVDDSPYVVCPRCGGQYLPIEAGMLGSASCLSCGVMAVVAS